MIEVRTKEMNEEYQKFKDTLTDEEREALSRLIDFLWFSEQDREREAKLSQDEKNEQIRRAVIPKDIFSKSIRILDKAIAYIPKQKFQEFKAIKY